MILEYFEAHRAFRKTLLTATASAAISAVSAATAAVMDAAPEVGITALWWQLLKHPASYLRMV